jgi:hypothetical protein
VAFVSTGGAALGVSESDWLVASSADVIGPTARGVAVSITLANSSGGGVASGTAGSPRFRAGGAGTRAAVADDRSPCA